MKFSGKMELMETLKVTKGNALPSFQTVYL